MEIKITYAEKIFSICVQIAIVKLKIILERKINLCGCDEIGKHVRLRISILKVQILSPAPKNNAM